jgi:hypothetical protein
MVKCVVCDTKQEPEYDPYNGELKASTLCTKCNNAMCPKSSCRHFTTNVCRKCEPIDTSASRSKELTELDIHNIINAMYPHKSCELPTNGNMRGVSDRPTEQYFVPMPDDECIYCGDKYRTNKANSHCNSCNIWCCVREQCVDAHYAREMMLFGKSIIRKSKKNMSHQEAMDNIFRVDSNLVSLGYDDSDSGSDSGSD